MRHRRLSALFCILLVALGATLLAYVGLGGVLPAQAAPGGAIALALTALLSVAIFGFLLFALHRFRVRR